MNTIARAAATQFAQMRNAAVILLIAGFLGSCATHDTAPSVQPETSERGGLGYVLNDLRLNPHHRSAADAYCMVVFRNDLGDDRVAPLLAGLLDVDETEVQQAFCLALVEATAAGELVEDEISGFAEQRSPNIVQFGTLLRKVLAAHLRLGGQSAFQPEVSSNAGTG